MQIDLEGRALTLQMGGGLKLTCLPCTTALMYAAVAAARDQLQAEIAAGTLPDDPAEREGRYRALLAAELARRAATGWDGAHDRKGKPLAFSADTIAAAMERHFGLADQFLAKYAEREDRWLVEGNGSGASPSGTGEEAPTTAAPAESSEPAVPAAEPKKASKGTASRTAETPAMQSAPTDAKDP